MTKRIIKFSLGALGMVLLGLGVLYAIQWYKEQNDPAQVLLREAKKMEERIYADKDGGDTPQETLQLFIVALQKGDMDQAAKYYVVPEQEKEMKELSGYTQEEIKNVLDHIAAALRGELKIESGRVTFSYSMYIKDGYAIIDGRKISVPDGNVKRTITLSQNPNRKWKILNL